MKKSLPWLSLIIGIFFSTIVWSLIDFQYNQSNTIIGQYSLNKVNPLNDTFRGLFFIFFPLLLYLIVLFKIDTQRFNVDALKINYQNQFQKRNINLLLCFLIFFCFLEFIVLDYKNFLGNFDSHHEGTFLSAQLNLKSKNNFWVGTFYDYGFLGNNIGIFFNYFFG